MLSSNAFSRIIEQLAPIDCAYEWDNCGYNLLTHDEIKGVYVCLDVTTAALDEAIKLGCDTILSHHPLLFKPLKKVSHKKPVDALFLKAAQANLNIYCAHTSYDCAKDGLNFKLAHLLGVKEPEILSSSDNACYVKVVTFLPDKDVQRLCEAMFDAGGGHIGKYSHCAYKSEGTGSFLPGEGTNPTIGSAGKLEYVAEQRVEIIVPRDKLNKVLAAIEQNHPYEEPAVDVYDLAYPHDFSGIGCIGDVKETDSDTFIAHVKNALNCESVRVNGYSGLINRVACVGGAGGEFFALAKAMGAQAIVTGEAKYNQFEEATSMGILLIEAGHFETEVLFVREMSSYLQMSVDELQCKVRICECASGIPYTYR